MLVYSLEGVHYGGVLGYPRQVNECGGRPLNPGLLALGGQNDSPRSQADRRNNVQVLLLTVLSPSAGVFLLIIISCRVCILSLRLVLLM